MEALQRLHNRGSVSTGYEINNSLKLEDDNTENLYRALNGSTSTTKFTVSMWAKRTEINAPHLLYMRGVAGNESVVLRFATESANYPEALQVDIGGAGGINSRSYTKASFRDASAWYHIVLAVDTTQSTATDRFKLYVNGVLETEYASRNNPAQNFAMEVSGAKHRHGAYNDTDGFAGYCGYIAECHYVDGLQVAQTEFGEFDDDSGIWKPKAYSGSYGTGGYYLDFSDSSALGNNSAGDGTDFTLNNITSADQATDTPTNNFCTMNPLIHMVSTDVASSSVIDGGTTISSTGTNYAQRYGTIGLNIASGGKWYWEFTANTSSNGNTTECLTGLIFENRANENTASPAVYSDDFAFYGGGFGHGAGYAANVVNGFLLDLDNNTLKWYRDDSLHVTMPDGTDAMPTTGLVFPYGAPLGSSFKLFMNFGGYTANTVSSGNTDPNGYGNFEFDTKGGYALCTKNLEEFG
jgi:hypothetical protein